MTDPSLNIAARKLIQGLDESLDGVKLKDAQKAFRRVNGEVIEDSCSAVWILGAPNCFVRTRVPELSVADSLVGQADIDFNASDNWELKNQNYRARVVKQNDGWHLDHLVRGRLDAIWPQLLIGWQRCFDPKPFSQVLSNAVGDPLLNVAMD